jgi:hypothetical protein
MDHHMDHFRCYGLSSNRHDASIWVRFGAHVGFRCIVFGFDSPLSGSDWSQTGLIGRKKIALVGIIGRKKIALVAPGPRKPQFQTHGRRPQDHRHQDRHHAPHARAPRATLLRACSRVRGPRAAAAHATPTPTTATAAADGDGDGARPGHGAGGLSRRAGTSGVCVKKRSLERASGGALIRHGRDRKVGKRGIEPSSFPRTFGTE